MLSKSMKKRRVWLKDNSDRSDRAKLAIARSSVDGPVAVTVTARFKADQFFHDSARAAGVSPPWKGT
jgi:hypothetical protein